jgi:glycosyltransferase involved in cell wall biosynthesis
VVAWGTYDLGKPRTRILLRGLREAAVDLTECHVDVWSGVDDKAQLSGWMQIARRVVRLTFAYPRLVWRYLWLPPHDVILVGYLGHLDVLILWPFARLRGVPIMWDAFMSLYETVVEDRAMVRDRSLVASLLRAWDWLACRAADIVLLDTRAHAQWFEKEFALSPGQTAAVFVGAEPDAFPALTGRAELSNGRPLRVLFYGQFIPLHGIETILEAASLTTPEEYAWTIVGTGQEAPRIRERLEAHPLPHLEWISWIPYEELRDRIAAADVCLGIFGRSGKAGRVIPNKAFQVIAAGRPLVTRDSPAIRELVDPEVDAVSLVPAGNPQALVAGIADLARRAHQRFSSVSLATLQQRITPVAIGLEMKALLIALAGRAGRP